MKKVAVISTSPRLHSNSDILADAFIKGTKESGNEVVKISLREKDIKFCKGCFACHKAGGCVIKDDAAEICSIVKEADVVVWATPIYYYSVSGQMKTMIDRLNPLYETDYKFRDVYLLTTAADDEPGTPDRAVAVASGWIDCFPERQLAGTLFCGGVNESGEIMRHPDILAQATQMGKDV